ncbi:MAG: GNAT family N-acetyltransferase [Rhodospirillales bacterium]|jgi:ribosomal protein S18 acetylase RimI-like enzyme
MTGAADTAGTVPRRAAARLRFQELDLETWSREIAPLWHMEGAAAAIPPTVNGHGQLQYCGAELARRVRFVPLAAELDGARVAWTSIYNISDQGLRLRGIYVQAQWRSNGIGRALVDEAIGRWPKQWDRVFLYARGENVARYRRWGFEIVPGHLPRINRQGMGAATGVIVQMMRLRPP